MIKIILGVKQLNLQYMYMTPQARSATKSETCTPIA